MRRAARPLCDLCRSAEVTVTAAGRPACDSDPPTSEYPLAGFVPDRPSSPAQGIYRGPRIHWPSRSGGYARGGHSPGSITECVRLRRAHATLSPTTRWRLVACSTGLRCTEQRVLAGPRLAGRRKAGVCSSASSRTGRPSMSGTPAMSAAAWPFWLSPVPVTITAAGTSGCRVLMVTHAASSAVITWRHDGIGTRRLHRPPFQARRHGSGEPSHNDARPWMLMAKHGARPRRSSRHCLLIQALRAEVVASVPATGGWWRQRVRLERLQRCRQQGRS
jgi:hypothetical protein